MASPVGIHILIDASDCDSPLLSDPDGLERLIVEAADAGNTDVVGVVKHQFTPRRKKANGATIGVLLGLGESHASIHTWPESGRWLADIFTCGARAKPDDAVMVLRRGLGGLVVVTRIERGH